MSVGSVRQRGQEGRPVLFPQQGLRCITVVRQTQVCLDRALDLEEEKKKELQQTTRAVLYSHLVCMSTYRGLLCGSDSATVFFFFCSLSYYVYIECIFPGRQPRNQDCVNHRLRHGCGQYVTSQACVYFVSYVRRSGCLRKVLIILYKLKSLKRSKNNNV